MAAASAGRSRFGDRAVDRRQRLHQSAASGSTSAAWLRSNSRRRRQQWRRCRGRRAWARCCACARGRRPRRRTGAKSSRSMLRMSAGRDPRRSCRSSTDRPRALRARASGRRPTAHPSSHASCSATEHPNHPLYREVLTGQSVRLIELRDRLAAMVTALVTRAQPPRRVDENASSSSGMTSTSRAFEPSLGPTTPAALHQVHQPAGLGEPDPQLALQHRGRAELRA